MKSQLLSSVLIVAIAHLVSACMNNYEYYDDASGDCLPCAATCITCFNATVCVTCASQFYLDDSKRCQPCSFGCGVCSSSSCSSCKEGFYMDSSENCLPCAEGVGTCTIALIEKCARKYFMLGEICAGCIDDCEECSDFSTCSLCSPGYYLSGDSSSCLKCSQNCLVCSDSSSCTSCARGYEITGNGDCSLHACASIAFCEKCSLGECQSCQRGKYVSNGTCRQGASLLCQESTGPYHTNCQTNNYACPDFAEVQNDLFSDAQLDVCLPIHASPLQEYIYVKNAGNICESVSSCSDAYSTSIQFSSLRSYYKIEYEINLKVYSVPTHQLLITYDRNGNKTERIQNIDITQEFAAGLSDSSCSNCSYGVAIVKGEIFVSGRKTSVLELSSSNGYFYPLQAMISLSVCQIDRCSVCNSEMDCQECEQPYYLQLIECVSECDPGFYKFGRTCVLQCPDISYPILATYECQACESSCATCYSQSQCLTCISNYYLEAPHCVLQCSTQQLFTNFSSGDCEKCPNPCLECRISNQTALDTQNSSTWQIVCISCRVGYVLENGECVYLCQNRTFANFINNRTECSQCASQCVDCFLRQDMCVSCEHNYLLNLGNSACQQNYTCPMGYYENQTINICQQCHYPCQTCEVDARNCTACIRGSLYNNTCPLQCPATMYAHSQSGTNVCLQCQEPCIECLSSQICTSCKNGTYLSEGKCYSECPVDFFYELAANNTCHPCEPPCVECLSETECLTCSTGFINVAAHSCELQCNQSSYVSDEFKCTLCPAPCVRCSNPLSCYQCSLPYVLEEEKCVTESQCEQMDKYVEHVYDYETGTPVRSSAVCTTCTYPCASCSSSPIVCTTCAVNYLLITQLNACSQSCPLSYYKETNTCEKCDTSCLDCEVAADNCTKCGTGMYLQDNTCILDCKPMFYGDRIESICKPCQAPCQHCYSLYLCSTCATGILYNKVCVQQCPEGTIHNSTLNECQLCTNNCQLCEILTHNCTACVNGFYFYQNACVDVCPKEYFADRASKMCEKCFAPCLQCLSATQCSSCTAGYYLHSSQCLFECPEGYYSSGTRTCEQCNSTICRSCDMDPNNCTQCSSGYYLDELLTNSCVLACPLSTYANPFSLSCAECIYPCTECTSINVCQACQDKYYTFHDFCYSACPIGYYPDPDSKCRQCPTNCQICVDAGQCSKCASNYFLDPSGRCQLQCKAGYYQGYDARNGYPKCLACPQSCKLCEQYSLCTQCVSDYLLNGLCVEGCPLMYHPITSSVNRCESCPENCNRCSNSTTCEQCLNSYIYEDLCYLQCPPTTYMFNQQLCRDCSNPCDSCLSEFECITCMPGYFFFINYCLESCPEDAWTYPENKSCDSVCPYNKHASERECYVSGCGGTMVELDGYCLQKCPTGYYVSLEQDCVRCEEHSGVCEDLFVGNMQILRTRALRIAIYFSQVSRIESIDTDKVSVKFTSIDSVDTNQRLLVPELVESASQITISENMIMIEYGHQMLNLYNIEVQIPYIQSAQSQQSISNNLFTATLHFYNDYSAETQQGISPINILAVMVCVAVGLCALANIVVKSSAFLQLLDFMQFVAATLYLEIQYPPVLSGYLKNLSVILWSFEPIVLELSPFAFSPSKYIENHIDTSLLRAHILVFLVFLLLFVSFMIIILINRLNPERCQAAVQRIRYRNLTDLFGILMLPLLLFAFHFDHSSAADIFCSFMVIVLSVGFLILISYKLITVKNSDELPGLMGDLEEMNNTLGKLYLPFSFARKIIFAFVLCVQPHKPLSTLTILLILTILIMVCLLLYQPFDNIITDYVCIFMETVLVIFIVLLILFGLDVAEGDSGHILGITALAFTLVAIACGLGWLIYLSFLAIKKFLAKPAETDYRVESAQQHGVQSSDTPINQTADNAPKTANAEQRPETESDEPSANSLLGRNMIKRESVQSLCSQGNEEFRHWNATDSSKSEYESASQQGPPKFLLKRQTGI